MIIKSPFVDYYDHVAHIYGGGDPNVIYIRKPFTRQEHSSNVSKTYPDLIVKFSSEELRKIPTGPYRDCWKEYDSKWLVINGAYFLLVRRGYSGDFKVLSKKEFPDLWDYLEKRRRERSYYDAIIMKRQNNPEWFVNSHAPELVKLSRLIDAPVFVISNSQFNTPEGCIRIESEIPILKDYGIPQIFTPQQLYQDISYFVGNTINESPDLAPPTSMGNSEKIVQHGFDLKQSFRHRK
jgi:hypothetical protein